MYPHDVPQLVRLKEYCLLCWCVSVSKWRNLDFFLEFFFHSLWCVCMQLHVTSAHTLNINVTCSSFSYRQPCDLQNLLTADTVCQECAESLRELLLFFCSVAPLHYCPESEHTECEAKPWKQPAMFSTWLSVPTQWLRCCSVSWITAEITVQQSRKSLEPPCAVDTVSHIATVFCLKLCFVCDCCMWQWELSDADCFLKWNSLQMFL